MKHNKILSALGFANGSPDRHIINTAIKTSILTLSCCVTLASFAQCGANDTTCELDPIIVIGGPVDDPIIDPLPPVNPPGCSFAGDPDCNNGDGGGGSGSGSSNSQQCLELIEMRDPTCLFDPVSPVHYNWTSLANSFANNLSSNTRIPAANGWWAIAPASFYNGLISSIARNYWYNQTYDSTNNLYWDSLVTYCTNEFPIIDNGILNFNYDRLDCYSRAYRASFTLLPSYSDSAYTIDSVEAFDVTIQHHSANDPLGNWGFDFFNRINKIKECKLWFDRKQELGCE